MLLGWASRTAHCQMRRQSLPLKDTFLLAHGRAVFFFAALAAGKAHFQRIPTSGCPGMTWRLIQRLHGLRTTLFLLGRRRGRGKGWLRGRASDGASGTGVRLVPGLLMAQTFGQESLLSVWKDYPLRARLAS